MAIDHRQATAFIRSDAGRERHQHAVLRDVIFGTARAVIRDALHDLDGFSVSLEFLRIERDCEKRCAAHVDEVTGWNVPSIAAAVDHDFALTRVEPLRDDSRVIPVQTSSDRVENHFP